MYNASQKEATIKTVIVKSGTAPLYGMALYDPGVQQGKVHFS